jgi:hypothetical protein
MTSAVKSLTRKKSFSPPTIKERGKIIRPQLSTISNYQTIPPVSNRGFLAFSPIATLFPH